MSALRIHRVDAIELYPVRLAVAPAAANAVVLLALLSCLMVAVIPAFGTFGVGVSEQAPEKIEQHGAHSLSPGQEAR